MLFLDTRRVCVLGNHLPLLLLINPLSVPLSLSLSLSFQLPFPLDPPPPLCAEVLGRAAEDRGQSIFRIFPADPSSVSCILPD